MRSVNLTEAKVGLFALLDAVEAGEVVVIARRGRSVARLIRESGSQAESGDRVARPRRFHAHQQGAGGVRSGAAAGAARSGGMRAAEIYPMLC